MAACSCCSICISLEMDRPFGTICLIDRGGTDDVLPDEVRILRFRLPSWPTIAPSVVVLLAPVPVVNSTRLPSFKTSLILLLVANSTSDLGVVVIIDDDLLLGRGTSSSKG